MTAKKSKKTDRKRPTAEKKYLVEAELPEITMSPRQLFESGTHKYLLVNVLARRARQLNQGAPCQVEESPETATYTERAVGEVRGDQLKLTTRPGKGKVMVSLLDHG